MYQPKLCMNLNRTCGMAYTDQIRLYKDVGFDGFFTVWKPEINVLALRQAADAAGMVFQSIHAPFGKVHELWDETEQTPQWMHELLQCVRDCADNAVPIMVCHAYIGFDKHTPTPEGLKNFETLLREAERLGVKIAFENTEGEEYLEALMNHFASSPAVGFCWDTGHEMCYNFPRDLLARYGNRLLCTHLNDNLGISDCNGKITPRDDLHLLPFDGIGDWQAIVRRLNAVQFEGPLTFELKTVSQPGRHDNDAYGRMAFEDYVSLAYQRACRVAALKLTDLNP